MVIRELYNKTILQFFFGFALIIITNKAQPFAGYFNYSFHLTSDTNSIDSMEQTVTNVIIDSSKLFTSLIASSNNQSIYNVSLNPEAKLFVDQYIRSHAAYLNNMKVWGKPYFDLYDKILTAYGVPAQLKYLSIIESSLSSTAISWAGAVGPWQMMADAAREYGLRTGNYDDRYDYVKSTNAAARMLSTLYSTYKDWLLVIAAYNCGTANVNRAITKARSTDFWRIQYYLPEETRNHVKKFIATHYYFEGNGSIATLTAAEAQNYVLNNGANKNSNYTSLISTCTAISVFGKYNSVVIANTVGMNLSIFNELNPGFDDALAKGSIYKLHLPPDKAALFRAKKIQILKQSVELFLSSANTSTPVK